MECTFDPFPLSVVLDTLDVEESFLSGGEHEVTEGAGGVAFCISAVWFQASQSP